MHVSLYIHLAQTRNITIIPRHIVVVIPCTFKCNLCRVCKCAQVITTLQNVFVYHEPFSQGKPLWDDEPRVGQGHLYFPSCPFTSLSFPFLLFFLSLVLLIFFFCQSLPFLPEQPHFVSRPEVVRSDRTWVQFVVFSLCYLYYLVKMDSGVLFCLVQFSFVCSSSALTLLVGSFDP